jgi:hypothetical protein
MSIAFLEVRESSYSHDLFSPVDDATRKVREKGRETTKCIPTHSLFFFPFPLKILAYTYYAFFEWSLIISDLAFDAVCLIDFETFEFRVVDIGMGGKREGNISALNDLKTYGGSEKGVGAAIGDIKPFEVISFAADVYLGMNKFAYFPYH